MTGSAHAKHDDRVQRRFDQIKAEGRGGLITFVTAGDPDPDVSMEIVQGLAGAGADLIELGMPFSDPMADGPSIQASGLRALRAGMTLKKTLGMVRKIRHTDSDTPVILMGYYNPIYSFGADAFVGEARDAGVDGLIIVDLPPEEDKELCVPARAAGLHWIRLATPTTDETRLPTVLTHLSGFIYYVSILGITGTHSPRATDTRAAVARLRKHTDLPVAVGFGIRTPQQAAEVAGSADAAVVGSAVVDKIKRELDNPNTARHQVADKVHDFVSALASGVRANAGKQRSAG